MSRPCTNGSAADSEARDAACPCRRQTSTRQSSSGSGWIKSSRNRAAATGSAHGAAGTLLRASFRQKLEAARAKLTDTRERPNGELKVTTTPGIGVHWLTPRLGEFIDLYPDIRITLLTTEEELDLAMREADVAIRLRQPTQPDLIQRKLFSLHFHACASPEYLKRFGTPRSVDELDKHRFVILGGTVPPWLQQTGNWLLTQGHDGGAPRKAWLTINNVLGVLRACQRGIGIAMLPDYLVEESSGLVQLFGDTSSSLAYDCYFVYPEELKSVARVQVFRDFLVSKAQRWHF